MHSNNLDKYVITPVEFANLSTQTTDSVTKQKTYVFVGIEKMQPIFYKINSFKTNVLKNKFTHEIDMKAKNYTNIYI